MKHVDKVAILGAGPFGTAMAGHMANLKVEQIMMWHHNKESALLMQQSRICPRLKNRILPPNVVVSSKLKETITNSDIIIIAVPSHSVEPTMKMVRAFANDDQQIIITSKGFASRQRLLLGVVKKLFPRNKVFYLCGPTLADEMSSEISAMVLTGDEGCEEMKNFLQTPKLRIHICGDKIGVQLGSALKNVVTVGIGLVAGSRKNKCQNTQAILYVMGFADILTIGAVLSADPTTFTGLSCLGDLTLHSRNRELGERLGRGETLPQIKKAMGGYKPEGLVTLKNAYTIAQKHKLHVPVISMLYEVIYRNRDPKKAIRELLLK